MRVWEGESTTCTISMHQSTQHSWLHTRLVITCSVCAMVYRVHLTVHQLWTLVRHPGLEACPLAWLQGTFTIRDTAWCIGSTIAIIIYIICVCVCVHVGPHWLIYLTHTHTHTLSRAVNHSLLHKVMRLTCYMYVHIGSYTQHTLTLSCNESLPYKVMRLNMLHLGPHWLIYLINTHTHTLMQWIIHYHIR